jgi:hypothetical protein
MDRVDYESIIIQDLANFYKNEELKLDPWYQRRSVWTITQKAYLINTVFVKKPVPTIYIRHYLDIEKEKSIKEIVDGQQRVRAVLGYINDEFAARHPGHSKPVKYSGLSPTQKTDFKMSKLSTGILVNAGEADVIEIFGRLNSISKTLNSQENRNAKFSGAMKQFCLEKAAEHVNFWRETGVFSATQISRMDEVQFISDITYNLVNGLSDFSAERINKLYKQYDEEFAAEASIKKRIDRVFKLLSNVDSAAFQDTIFSRSPLFFSLFMALDEKGTIAAKKLEQVMHDIDAIYNEPKGQKAKDRAFIDACTASTQRIKSRNIRHAYILEKLS